jgi:hypothetical protein
LVVIESAAVKVPLAVATVIASARRSQRTSCSGEIAAEVSAPDGDSVQPAGLHQLRRFTMSAKANAMNKNMPSSKATLAA